jgi:hypothetical protein
MLNKISVHFFFKSATEDIAFGGCEAFEDWSLGWLVHVLGSWCFWFDVDKFIWILDILLLYGLLLLIQDHFWSDRAVHDGDDGDD